MGKSRFRTQKNGRVRGTEDMGDGPFQETSPMGHGTFTKNKREQEIRAARKAKQNRWEEY